MVLSPFMQWGGRCLADVFRRLSGRPLKGGYPVVVQTHGRHGQYNPQLHSIATSGGLAMQANEWVPLDSLPYPMLRQKWQGSGLTMRRHTLKTRESNRLVALCYTRYPNGFVTNVHKGDVPSRYERLARYLAQYVVSPPISRRRIDS
jgi:Putative transposase